ncbi:MAG TPA: hypothetical protein VNO52_16620, partial [Methylomirabilota bacterium]|nr:hypothetical protein [Methylomirabilota bacterium]
MNTKLHPFLAGLCALLISLTRSPAQGTAFTYQGRLESGGSPANGIFDLQFAVFDSSSGGALVARPLTNSATAVSNGLFTTTLDFGAGVFTGLPRWLGIAVRTNGAAAFDTLNPRQPITATPYALHAAGAGSAQSLSGTISAAQLTGTISSNQIGAGAITADKLAAGAVGAGHLAAGAVTTPALADGAVTAQKVAMATNNNWFALTLANPTPAIGDVFGYAVAAVGADRVLIGVAGDDTGAPNAGATYLFHVNGTLLTAFTNPTPAFNEQFGHALAAVGTDRVLVGAAYDDTGAADAGAAYFFHANGTLLTTFTNPTPAVGDRFGYAVAAVGTDRVLIGAYFDDTGATNAGAAYLFSTNGTLLTTFTKPTPAPSDLFGIAVTAVGTDRVLIGAAYDDMGATDAGAAYLFSRESYAPGLIAEGVAV